MKHIACIAIWTGIVIWMTSCGQATQQGEPVPEVGQPATVASPVATVDKNKIAGSWARTDAPYQLVISDVAEDGTMKATYLNPNPIHVSKSNWINGNGVISLYVELRDENYPGSNYTLTYLPDRDMLAGKYFQAVEGVTYEVAFSRGK